MKSLSKTRQISDSTRLEALSASQAIIEFSPDGIIQFANQNFLDAVGYQLDEIVGKHHSIFVVPSDRDSRSYQDFWQSLRAGKFQTAEYRRIRKDGKDIWIQASYNPLFDKSGNVIGIMKIAADTTAAKRVSAENAGQIEALNKSQAVIHFSPDGTILWANDNFLDAVGYSRDEIYGKHHSMFVPQEELGPSYDQFWLNLRRGQFQSAEYRRIAKGGREFFINASYNPIVDIDGKVFKVVKFATDETDRVERMNALKTIDVDLARIQAAVNQVNALAESSATASHETAGNVESVAAGSVQLSTSVKDISSQVCHAETVSGEAVEKAKSATHFLSGLSDSAEQISSVVKLISDIAAQTNLLALNATIEAARAGEAGKGFAVVASEVKELASQSASATEDITKQILSVQTATREAVNAILGIEEVIRQVNEIAMAMSSTIEEQSAVTGTISSNMSDASAAVSQISQGFKEISSALQEIRSSTDAVKSMSAAFAA